MIQGPWRALISYLFITILATIITACSGGGSGTGAQSGSTASALLLDVEPGPIVILDNVGETATLDGSYSSASSNEALSYEWSFTSVPTGSNAQLIDPTGVTPSFVADVAGTYRVQLIVSANGVTSHRTVAIVQVQQSAGPVQHNNFSSDCKNCHSGDYLVVGTKIANHLATSNMCQACHSTFDFTTISFVDHQEVFGNCSECHDGVKAVGKSLFHEPTNGECSDCHNTIHFLNLQPDGSYDHTNLSRLCSACHNGVIATGKTDTTTHNATTSECGYCHTTATFTGAYPDHSSPDVLSKRCDSCHGVDATGPITGHPNTQATGVDCNVCHTVSSFAMQDGLFNHSLVDASVQPCSSCHFDGNGINAKSTADAVTQTAISAHQATTSDCGACHNTEAFIPAFGYDHSLFNPVSDRCDDCHGVDASGIPDPRYDANNNLVYKHIERNGQDCNDCHTPGTFSTGTYSHSGPSYVGNCESCHNNVISVGKLDTHIPTSQDCIVCHNDTGLIPADWVPADWSHSGIVDNCALCHNGTIATGKSANHYGTSQDCSVCHVDTVGFTTFTMTSFNHAGIDNNNCAACHNTGLATPKTLKHIPSQDECSLCHNDTANFRSTTFMSDVHQGISTGCEGCHSEPHLPLQSNLTAKVIIDPNTHLPTDQDCYVCHTNSAFSPSKKPYTHTGITGNCVSCHNGSFTAIGALGKADDPTPPHPDTTQDCDACHNTDSFYPAFMIDHTDPAVLAQRCDACHGVDATGKNNGHVQTNEDCGLCHEAGGSFANAIFDHTGIVDNCASCHDGANPASSFIKGATHLVTSQDCSVCHNTTAFAGAKFNHTGIVDNCADCHDGVIAIGKSTNPPHVPTNEDCSVCHQTTGFIPATFSHAGITSNCSSCHDAGFAQGKSDGHVVTNQDCGVCHNTTTFVPATFDHTGIVDNCSSCHAGDKSTNHPATSLDCHFCHSTATFAGGGWVHDASAAGNCDSCHSNTGGATSKPSGHLNTIAQCDDCHSTSGWTPTDFSHPSSSNYPGDHRRDPGCTGCHKGAIGAGINSDNYPDKVTYAPYCAGCHASDFKRESKHIGGSSGTVEQNKNCGQSGCHRVSSSGW